MKPTNPFVAVLLVLVVFAFLGQLLLLNDLRQREIGWQRYQARHEAALAASITIRGKSGKPIAAITERPQGGELHLFDRRGKEKIWRSSTIRAVGIMSDLRETGPLSALHHLR